MPVVFTPPPVPDADFAKINEQVRFVLTGDANSPKPTDAQLAMVVPAEVERLLQAYPCCGAGGTVTLTENDRSLFERAAGFAAAAAFLSTLAGRAFALAGTEVKVGPVTRKRAQIDPTTVVASAQRDMLRTLGQITCIRLARQARSKLGLFNAVHPPHPRRFGTTGEQGLVRRTTDEL